MAFHRMTAPILMTLDEVAEHTGLDPVTIIQLETAGLFPTPAVLHGQPYTWHEADILSVAIDGGAEQ